MPTQRISFEQARFLPDRSENSANMPPEILLEMNDWRIRDGSLNVSHGYYNPIPPFTTTGPQTLQNRPTFGTNLNFSDDPEILYFSGPASGDRTFRKVIHGTNQITDTRQTLSGNAVTFNDGDPFEWESFDWGEITVLHNPQYAPIYASSGSSANDLTNLTNWQTNDRTDYMFPFDTYMVGLGYHGTTPGGSAIDSERVIITSSRITTFNQLPTWPLGNVATSTSAIYPIDGLVDGNLIAGGRLQNFAVIYTDVNALRIEDDEGALILTPLFTDSGLLARNSWCQIPNGHFCIGASQIYIHDGSTKKIIGQDQWSDTFFSRLVSDRLTEVQCEYNPRSDTVWIKIPRGSTEEIWVYNVEGDYIEEIRTNQRCNWMYFTTEGLPFSSLTATPPPPFPVDQEEYEGNRAFRNRMITFGGPDGTTSFFVQELGTDYGGTAIPGSLGREGIVPFDGYSRTQMMRVVPFYYGTGSVTMRFGGSNEVGTASSNVASKTMTRGTDVKFDMRFTRRYLSYTLESSSAGLSVAAMDVEFSDKYKR